MTHLRSRRQEASSGVRVQLSASTHPLDSHRGFTVPFLPTTAELVERVYRLRLGLAAAERELALAQLEEIRNAQGADQAQVRAIDASVDFMRVMCDRDPTIITDARDSDLDLVLEIGSREPDRD